MLPTVTGHSTDDGNLTISPMQPGEEERVSELVIQVFKTFIAPHYAQHGVEEILSYFNPGALASRARVDHFVLLAKLKDDLVGVIEVRKHSHVSLLFVDGRYQRQGIARQLLNKSIEIIREKNPQLDKLTVNSSPNAVEAYRKMGFLAEGEERIIRGVKFQVMSRPLIRREPETIPT
jgi:ribosomal protein S18 acetylase RimI-like enzyme